MARMLSAGTFRGYTITPKIGMAIMGDEWRSREILESSDWDKAEFRHTIHGNGPITSMACNVRITGRTIQRNKYFDRCVRVEISVPDDGSETGCKFPGWLAISHKDLIYTAEFPVFTRRNNGN